MKHLTTGKQRLLYTRRVGFSEVGGILIDREDALYLYLLLVRFNLITLVALSFLAATYFQGWLDTIIKAELVKLSGVIAALFLYGFIWSTIGV